MADPVSATSDELFGAPFRLRVAAVIAAFEDDEFRTGAIEAADSSIGSANASRNLLKLVSAGVVERLERGRYRRNDSVLWEFAVAFVAEIARRPGITLLPEVREENGDG